MVEINDNERHPCCSLGIAVSSFAKLYITNIFRHTFFRVFFKNIIYIDSLVERLFLEP